MKKVQISSNWVIPLYEFKPLLLPLAHNSLVLGLSNEVKNISEFQVVFQIIAKNLGVLDLRGAFIQKTK